MADPIMIYRTNAEKLNIPEKEIYRYMGYTMEDGQAEKVSEGEVAKLVEQCTFDVRNGSQMIVCYGRFPVRVSADGRVDFGFTSVLSRNLADNLAGCSEVIIFAATIGIYIDKQISRQLLISPARACVYQAEIGRASCRERV